MELLDHLLTGATFLVSPPADAHNMAVTAAKTNIPGMKPNASLSSTVRCRTIGFENQKRKLNAVYFSEHYMRSSSTCFLRSRPHVCSDLLGRCIDRVPPEVQATIVILRLEVWSLGCVETSSYTTGMEHE
jgi:hypothetical protein